MAEISFFTPALSHQVGTPENILQPTLPPLHSYLTLRHEKGDYRKATPIFHCTLSCEAFLLEMSAVVQSTHFCPISSIKQGTESGCHMPISKTNHFLLANQCSLLWAAEFSLQFCPWHILHPWPSKIHLFSLLLTVAVPPTFSPEEPFSCSPGCSLNSFGKLAVIFLKGWWEQARYEINLNLHGRINGI